MEEVAGTLFGSKNWAGTPVEEDATDEVVSDEVVGISADEVGSTKPSETQIVVVYWTVSVT